MFIYINNYIYINYSVKRQQLLLFFFPFQHSVSIQHVATCGATCNVQPSSVNCVSNAVEVMRLLPRIILRIQFLKWPGYA